MAAESLSYDRFVECIEKIIQISNTLSDGWILNTKAEIDNGTYITKKSTIPVKNSAHTVAIFEYHIVFHLSYSVPVLCLNVWRSDGSLLTMKEVWKLSPLLMQSNMYETLTQMDHPVLCRPFLMLHPCKTEEIIKPFLEKSKNPVVSWMSVVGPFVHLEILNDYIRSCF